MKTRKTARKQVKKNPSSKKRIKSISELVNNSQALKDGPLTESYFTSDEHEPRKSKGADEEL